MVPITFRKLRDNEAAAAGELWIRPAREEDRERRATALLVLEQGMHVLERGPGPAERIVVDAGGTQPTFDEMLAALFAGRLLEGMDLPTGFRSFARYAELLRKGLVPTKLPPEETLEGIYLAIRNLPGE